MKFAFVLMLVLLVHSVFAQEKWTLTKCIDYAYENNLQLKLQELSIKAAKSLLVQSKAAYLPSLNASASQSYSSGRSVDPFTNEFTEEETVRSDNFSLSSNVSVFQGFRNHFALKQSKYSFLASLQDLDKTKNDMALSISSAFLQVLLSTEVVIASENAYNYTKKQFDRTTQLFEANSISQGPLLEMEAQLARDEMQWVNSKNQLYMARLSLMQLLDLDISAPFEIEIPANIEPNPTASLMQVEDIYRQALGQMPQVLAAENRQKAGLVGLRVAQSSRSPRLTLSAAYGTGFSDARKNVSNMQLSGLQQVGFWSDSSGSITNVYAPSYTYDYTTRAYKDQLKDNTNKSLAFNLTIPIFNNWQANNSISQAKINYLNASYSKDIVLQQLKKEISQAYADAQSALSQFNMSKKVYEASLESFKYSENRFENGMVNTVEYSLAKTNLDKAQSDLIQAKYQLIFREKVLDFYMGNALKL